MTSAPSSSGGGPGRLSSRRAVIGGTMAALLGAAVAAWLGSGKAPAAPRAPMGSSAAESLGARPRYASLSPAITETLIALGAADDLVAVSDFDEPSPLPRVGTVLSPNFERLAQTEPTLILATQTQSARSTELGRIAPTHEIPWLSVDEVVAGVAQLGQLTHHARAGEALAEQLRAELSPRESSQAPRVLLVIGGAEFEAGALYYIRQHSLHGALLGALGYRHALLDDPEGPPRLSFERLLAVDPDAVIVLRPEAPDRDKQARLLGPLRALEPLSANRTGRLRVLARPGLLTMGPGILESKRALGALLEELFGTPSEEPRSGQEQAADPAEGAP